MKPYYEISSKRIRLRPLEHKDIESLRTWRNDPNLTTYLSKIGHITPEMQENWFKKYLADDTEITFAIEYILDCEPVLVGSVALYDMEDHSCECGKFMIGNMNYKGKKLGGESLELCMKLAFDQMGMERCIAHAHPLNAPSLVSFINIGFQIKNSRDYADGGFEYGMELTKERYRKLYGEV